MQKFKDLNLSIKLIGSFLLVSLIAITITISGVIGLKTINSNFIKVLETSPLIDAAMEMKIAVARDMQMIMEILALGSEKELNDVWKEHETFVKEFELFAGAVLEGAETEEGIIYPSTDEKLRDIVKKAEKFHSDEFQPKIKHMFDLVLKRINGEEISLEELGKYDKKADEVGEKMLIILGEIEDIARLDIHEAQIHTSDTTNFQIKLLSGIGVISILLGFFITKIIVTPISRANDFAGKIAKGDLTQHINLNQKDEIGTLAESLNNMSKNLRQMFTDIASGTNTLNTSSTELSDISATITTHAADTADKSNTVAAAAEEMSSNMDSVAAAQPIFT